MYNRNINTTQRENRIILNVSGKIFETYEKTLNRYPETLLGDKKKRNSHYCSKTNQYFFDRNRLCFDAILFLYQSNGILNCPAGVQIPIFEEECRYFELPVEIINKMKRKEGIIFELDEDDNQPAKFPFKMQVSYILENPKTSYAAWIFGMFSLSMIWLSIVTAFLETTRQYRHDKSFPIMELVLNIWFLIELILRFLFSRSKFEFVRGTMNWVDVFAVVPYFLVVILQLQENGLLGVFRTLKFIRVIRLFRLSKLSRRLKIVGIILKSCLDTFKLLIICIIMMIFIGGSCIYLVESSINHIGFTSIPQGLWWSVQTITSVGYGDLIPLTSIGRLLAGTFMLCSILIYIPLFSVVSQFTWIYPKNVKLDTYLSQYESAQAMKNMKKRHRRNRRQRRIKAML